MWRGMGGRGAASVGWGPGGENLTLSGPIHTHAELAQGHKGI